MKRALLLESSLMKRLWRARMLECIASSLHCGVGGWLLVDFTV